MCCSNELQPYQPKNAAVLKGLAKNKHNFNVAWFSQFSWLTVCLTLRRVFCKYCQYCAKHNLLTFSKNSSPAFISDGFDNWKKALEKFGSHSASSTHKEAAMKWLSLGKPSLPEQFHVETVRLQKIRRNGLLKQLTALKFLLRQGLAIRGHKDEDGNMYQLLQMLAGDCNPEVVEWLRQKKYMSADIVNEQITIMGQSVLRTLLSDMKKPSPAWFSVLCDEATDVANKEQFNLSVRWVDDDYNVHEVPLGLFCLPNITANTLTTVLKDLLLRCNLPLSLCRGQAYDGASNMHGRRKGVSTQIWNENPAALPVHCFAHCLNLCLQDVGRQIAPLRDALDVVKEISKLIAFSPKRAHLFSTKLSASSSDDVLSIKPFCPTRWTARTVAIDAVLKDYTILIETMDEVNQTTHDDNGLKARGVLLALEKFDTYFWLKFGHLIFGVSEEVSKQLQSKHKSIQEGLQAVDLASAFYKRQRTDSSFSVFYEQVVGLASSLGLEGPKLPRYRKAPARLESGSLPHRFSNPRDYYRHLYFQTCDLLIRELEDRFDQRKKLAPVLILESIIVNAANGDSYDNQLEQLDSSCFAGDFDLPTLKRQLPLLVDVIKAADPQVCKVTSIHTVCDALNTSTTYKQMLSEVHKLLRLYQTVPVTTATSERSFSALRRLFTYLRTMMT